MGLLPKYKVEEAKRLRKQAKLDKKRKINTRNIAVSFLIVCEGTRTEPNYFESLIKNRYSAIREVEINGEGRGTVSLIKKVIEIRDKSDKEFDRVWAVFDKDDFEDFNDAIKLAKRNGIHCAWSNESFELWYYLHFEYLDTGVSRNQYIAMIEREIRKKSGNENYTYKKKAKDTYSLLQQFGDESLAFAGAARLKKCHTNCNFASHKPCTTVDELVKELSHPEILLQ
ncbi:MAG: RloB family protein [Parabacteroides sp.]|nr:RloB family protein [Parabacteroides sp.]